MATVYLARDLRHNRRVALKVLRPDLAAVLGSERFLSEIEVTANLQHPNLLPLFDSGAAGDLLFYVMPYVQGESLRARIDREKQLPVEEAVRIATAIGNALDYAHRQGVIHRDLKPENILLQEGQPLVADFGIALAVSKAGGARVTQTGLSLGTPQYMSPEQATGDRVIDARTDIYSLGALTYEMLTGEPPHVGTTAQAIIARLLTERPRSARSSRPAIPEHVEAALERSLEKLPADRWATAHEFAEALAGTRPVTRVAAVPSGNAVAPAPRVRITPRELTAWAATAALAVVVGAMFLRGRQAQPPEMLEFELSRPDSVELTGGSAARIAISPDGRTVVFLGSYPDGSRMLFSRALHDRSVRPIAGSEGASAVKFSPDGADLLFSAQTGLGSPIMRLPLVGGVARQFATGGTSNGQYSWGRDGRVLYRSETPGSEGIYIKPADAGSAELVVQDDSARGHVRYGYPHWLPGQRKALVSVWRTSTIVDSVYVGVLDVERKAVTDLDVRGLFPQYTDAGYLLFVNTEGALSAAPFDAEAGALLGRPVVLELGVGFGTGAAASYAVAPNGTLAMHSTRQSAASVTDVSLVARGLDGSRRALGLPKGSYRRPRVSPDGRQVVFVGSAQRAGTFSATTSDVWRAELSAASLYKVTTTGTADRAMFARDGRSILFTATSETGMIFEVGLEAGATPRERARWPRSILTGDLGPVDGYAVFGSGGGSSTDLWLAPMRNLSDAQPFAVEKYAESLPRISPDGRFVAFTSSRTGVEEIYVRQLPSGGEEVRVSAAGGIDPVWAPSGRVLYYRDARDSLYAAELTFTPRVRVTSNRALFRLDNNIVLSTTSGVYDVLPNGREFVFFERTRNVEAASSPIVVRMNWVQALSAAQDR